MILPNDISVKQEVQGVTLFHKDTPVFYSNLSVDKQTEEEINKLIMEYFRLLYK